MSDSSVRWRYGLYAVIAGFLAVIICLTIVVVRYPSPQEAITVAAPAITAIGALAGAYFGVQAGSAGKAESDASRDEAQRLALTFAAVAEPEAALYVLGLPGPPTPDGGGGGGDEAAPPTVESAGGRLQADGLTVTDMAVTDMTTDKDEPKGSSSSGSSGGPDVAAGAAGRAMPDSI